MAKDTTEITVGANGSIYVAPLETSAPADIDAAWGAGWVDLGYASEDGVTLTDEKTIKDIPVWQLFYPARKIVTDKNFTAAFALRQFNGANVRFAFGGGDVQGSGGKFKYIPPEPGDIDERMLGIEWIDGVKNYRLIIERGMVVENVETQVVRTDPSDLPITFGIVGEEGVDPWYILTDDDSFADQVGS